LDGADVDGLYHQHLRQDAFYGDVGKTMQEFFLTWFMVFIRAGAMLSIFPIFSAAAMPMRIRIALAGFLAMLSMPGVSLPEGFIDGDSISFVGLIAKEVAFGLLLGFVCRLILFAVALAGHYIGGQLGLQLSSLIAPGESTPSQTPAVMLQMITVMLIFSLDIHFELLMGFQQSYNVLTIGGGHLSDALFTEITGLCARTFVVALRIAAPLIAVGIVVNLLMMVLGRTIPEVNVFILSFSIRILVGIFLFGFTLSLAAREITNYLRHLPDDFVVVTRLLAGG
jgi:flagellar biosynthetic protein FliR